MATGQTLLDTIELLDQETQLQSGEADVVRGLLALNRAQDFFESIVARTRGLFGDTTGNVASVASTETSLFPAGVLRIDRLQHLNPTSSLPQYDLVNITRTGGHRWNTGSPFWWSTPNQIGRPDQYWTNGRSIYWSPLPDAAYSFRWYGFQVAADISAGGTFAYPDVCILPFASFASSLMKIGVGDDVSDIEGIGRSIIQPVVDDLANFNRDGAKPFEYRDVHLT